MPHDNALKLIRDVAQAGPMTDSSWDSFEDYRIPQWYREGKLGIFIHWGVYSVPAFGSEWYARFMYKPDLEVGCYEHHVKTYGPVDQFGYKDFIPMFKAEHYDPAAWAALFKEAGAAFVMPVAEHHDGFAMYDTPLNRWNAKAMGPKRDVTADLAVEVRKAGMRFAVSSHREENYWFFNAGRLIDSDVQDPANVDLYGPALGAPPLPWKGGVHANHGVTPGDEWLDDWLVRTCELVDKFKPEVVFFDWWIQEVCYADRLRTFAAYYYNRCHEWGIQGAINFKHEAMPVTAGVFDVERGQLSNIRPVFWQTDTSLSTDSWCYTRGMKYRTAISIVHDFIDIVSKNGALLLNVGPKADGTIPEEQQALLRALGAWMKINADGIYGTKPWKIYGEGPTPVPEGMFAEKKRVDFTAEDLRFTTRGGKIYGHFLGWPEDGVLSIKSFLKDSRYGLPNVGSVELLGHDGPLSFHCDEEAMHVKLPAEKFGDYAWCLRVSPG